MNYSDLDKLLSDFQAAVENPNPQRGYWRALWELETRIRLELHVTRYPTRESKRNAWHRLNDLKVRANRRKDERKLRLAEGDQLWEQRLAARFEMLSGIVARGDDPAGANVDLDLANVLGASIIALLDAIQLTLGQAQGIEHTHQMKRELLHCNTHMKQAWVLFQQQKEEMRPLDRGQVYRILKATEDRINEAWNRWKNMTFNSPMTP